MLVGKFKPCFSLIFQIRKFFNVLYIQLIFQIHKFFNVLYIQLNFLDFFFSLKKNVQNTHDSVSQGQKKGREFSHKMDHCKILKGATFSEKGRFNFAIKLLEQANGGLFN